MPTETNINPKRPLSCDTNRHNKPEKPFFCKGFFFFFKSKPIGPSRMINHLLHYNKSRNTLSNDAALPLPSYQSSLLGVSIQVSHLDPCLRLLRSKCENANQPQCVGSGPWKEKKGSLGSYGEAASALRADRFVLPERCRRPRRLLRPSFTGKSAAPRRRCRRSAKRGRSRRWRRGRCLPLRVEEA